MVGRPKLQICAELVGAILLAFKLDAVRQSGQVLPEFRYARLVVADLESHIRVLRDLLLGVANRENYQLPI